MPSVAVLGPDSLQGDKMLTSFRHSVFISILCFAAYGMNAMAESVVETCDSDFHSLFGVTPETLTISGNQELTGLASRDTADGKHHEFVFANGLLQEFIVDERLDPNIRSSIAYNLDIFSRQAGKTISIDEVYSYRIYTLNSDKDGDLMTFTVLRNRSGRILFGKYRYGSSPGIYGLCRL